MKYFMIEGHNETLDESVTMETKIHQVFIRWNSYSKQDYTVAIATYNME